MSAPRLLLTAALFPLFLSTTGCVSYWRGQEMSDDLVALQGQVDQLQDSSATERKKLNADLQAAVARIEKLEKKATDAIERLRTGSADYGMELEQVRDLLQGLNGEVAELKHKLQQAQANALPAPPVENGGETKALPEKEGDLYRYGYERKRADDCKEAVRAFSEYARRFPKAAQADNAIYLMAECLAQSQDHTASLRSLRIILEKYPKGDKVDDALVLTHDNFVALGRCKDGIPFLDKLLAEMPRSNRAKEARKKLATSKRKCK